MSDSNKTNEIENFSDGIAEKQSLKHPLDTILKEQVLKEALEKDPSVLEEGLSLVVGGSQLPIDVPNINLLMRDRDKNYVVVELKKGKTEDGVVGQTLRYMGWVRENLSKGKVVRGIIVVPKGEVTNKLEMAIKGLQHTQQLIKLKEIPITVGNVRDVL
jgi:RecB family endonuclease NucS